jgi:hypothetical protein
MLFAMDGNKQERQWLTIEPKTLKWIKANNVAPKVGTIKRIHLLNLQGENNPKGVKKLSQKDHLLINVTFVETPTWKNHEFKVLNSLIVFEEELKVIIWFKM